MITGFDETGIIRVENKNNNKIVIEPVRELIPKI